MDKRHSDPPTAATVNEAVSVLIKGLSRKHFDDLRATKWTRLDQHYMGLARFIRNIFGLHGDNPQLLRSAGTEDPYQASMVIPGALWRHLRLN